MVVGRQMDVDNVVPVVLDYSAHGLNNRCYDHFDPESTSGSRRRSQKARYRLASSGRA